MKIQCLFIVRDERTGPELLVAWDEYTIYENAEGWHEECTEALADLQYLRHAYIDIEVDESELTKKLMGSTITGKVV